MNLILCNFGSSWLNAGSNCQRKKYIFLYKYSFLHYLNNLRVPMGKKPAPRDHESDDQNNILLLTNSIHGFILLIIDLNKAKQQNLKTL